MLSKFSFYGLFSGQFYQLFQRTHRGKKKKEEKKPLTQVCMETSWLYERKLPLAADELGQALAAKTFKAPLSFHLPWLLFFPPNFPPHPVFNKTVVILYTFLSLIQ